MATEKAPSSATSSRIYSLDEACAVQPGHGRPESPARHITASLDRIDRPGRNATPLLGRTGAGWGAAATHGRRGIGQRRRSPLRENHREPELHGREVRIGSCGTAGRASHHRDEPSIRGEGQARAPGGAYHHLAGGSGENDHQSAQTSGRLAGTLCALSDHRTSLWTDHHAHP